MSFTIIQKLYAAFFAVLLLFSGTSVFVILKEAELSDITVEVSGDDVPGAFAYMQLIDELGDVNNGLFAIVNNIPNAEQDYREDKQELLNYYKELYALESRKPEDRAAMGRLKSSIDTMFSIAEQQIINSSNSQQDKLKVLVDLGKNHISKIEDTLEFGAEEEREDTAKAMKNIKSELDFLNVMLSTISILAIITAVFLAWTLGSSIKSRLKQVASQAGKIAQGQLNVPPLSVSENDEISELSESINNMQHELTVMVQQIKRMSHEVGDSSDQLVIVNQQVGEGISAQQQKADQISTAASQMSQSITEVARQSVDAADIASQAGRSATHGCEIVNEMVSSIREVSTTIQDLSDSVGNLGDRGKQIGEVIKVINEIAEQTNLLALNAAIEAARAGEQGRGFAVVADEVRGLASRTATATQEVAQSISAIQQETDIAVSRMTQSTEVVDKGVTLSEEAIAALEEIVSQADTVNRMIDSVAASAEEQAAVTKEISNDISDIHVISNQASDNAQTAQTSVQLLSEKAHSLEDTVAKFRV